MHKNLQVQTNFTLSPPSIFYEIKYLQFVCQNIHADFLVKISKNCRKTKSVNNRAICVANQANESIHYGRHKCRRGNFFYLDHFKLNYVKPGCKNVSNNVYKTSRGGLVCQSVWWFSFSRFAYSGSGGSNPAVGNNGYHL